MSRHASPLRGIVYALGGFSFWVLTDTTMKLAGENALPPYQVVAFLGIVAMLLLTVKAAAQKKLKALWPRRPMPQLARAALSVGSNIGNAIALNHLPLTSFYVIAFSAPMVIALLATVVLRERMGIAKFLAILAGFGGVVIAVNPAHILSGGNWIGYAGILFSVACFAVSSVWLRAMSQSETVDSMAFVTGLVEAVPCLALMLVWHTEPMNARLLLTLFAMGACGVIGNFLYYDALRLAPAATVAPFHYTQIIMGAIIGFVVWNDVPSIHTLVGAAIITGAGLSIAAHASRTARRDAARAPHEI